MGEARNSESGAEGRVIYQAGGASAVGASRRSYRPHIAAVVVLGVLALVTSVLWLEQRERFPLPRVGSYYGLISGLESEPIPFFLERAPHDDNLLVVVLRAGWQPHVATPIVRDGAAQSSLLPLTVVGPDTRLRFIGSAIGEGIYAGTVETVGEGEKRSGTWLLDGLTLEQSSHEQLASMLALHAELQEVEQRVRLAEAELPRVQAEVDRLTDFITEGHTLRSRAEEKFASLARELAEAQAEVRQQQSTVATLERQITLAQKVTPMGKLVSLARESLEREARWADAVLKSAALETDPEIQALIAQGERIAALEREIERERGLVQALQYGRGAAVLGEGREIED